MRDTSAEREIPDDSSTDVSDSLMGHYEGKSWDSENGCCQQDKKQQLSKADQTVAKTILGALKSWRWLVDLVLLVFIIGLLLERRKGDRTDNYYEFEGTGDITGFAPKISQQITTFVPDFSYAPENASEFFTDAVQNKWLAMVPKGLGYVKVDNPSKYNNLPTRLQEFTNTTVYTTSMTHQLHCLHAIVEVFSALMSDPDKVPEETPWHLNHCFEYLRQNILCCGDTALEGEATTFPPGVSGSDGWDAKHVCKDYGQIYNYLYENRADDSVWI